MNKNYMFLGFVCISALGIIGAAFLYLFNAPGVDRFVQYIFNSLMFMGTIATTLWGLNKAHNQQEKTMQEVEVVKAQTNGSLHTRDQRIKELENENSQLKMEKAVAETLLQERTSND